MQSPMRSPMTGQDSGYAEECYPFQLLGTCAAAWRRSSFGAPPGMLSGPAWGRTKRRAMRDGMAKDLHEARSGEHTSELQSLMRISYAVFCLKKKKKTNKINTHNTRNQQHTANTKTLATTKIRYS